MDIKLGLAKHKKAGKNSTQTQNSLSAGNDIISKNITIGVNENAKKQK